MNCCDCLCACLRRILCHKRLTPVKEFELPLSGPDSTATATASDNDKGDEGGDEGGGDDGGSLSRATVESIIGQSSLWDFEPFREYCSVMLNFCWVCFFSVIFPWGPLCAFVNNAIEVRSDMYKLSSVMQRPFPRHATSTGPWQDIQDLVVRFSTIVNVALLILTLDVFSHFFGASADGSGIKWEHALLGVLVFERLALTLISTLWYAVPERSQTYTKYLAARSQAFKAQLIDHESRQRHDGGSMALSARSNVGDI